MEFDSSYADEMEAARDAARKAGKILDRYRRKGAEVNSRKNSHNDIVTEADLKAQEKIIEVLRDRFPADAIKAEERELDETHSDRVWVIDPIDGTTNFFHGLDHSCVSIGLKIGAENVLGVVHSPQSGLGTSFIGLKGDGAYRLESIDADEGEALEPSRTGMKGGLYTTYVRDGEPRKRERQIAIIEALSSRDMVHRAIGSAALDLCMIAEGEMDLMADYLSEWDYAAGKAILEEAGGEVEVIGQELDQDVALASNGEFHDEAAEVVREVLERF